MTPLSVFGYYDHTLGGCRVREYCHFLQVTGRECWDGSRLQRHFAQLTYSSHLRRTFSTGNLQGCKRVSGGSSTGTTTSFHRFLWVMHARNTRATCLLGMGILLEHFLDCSANRLFDSFCVFHWVSAWAVLQRLTRASAPDRAPGAGISDVDYQHSF